jgi:PAS domain S-box-containing protein
LEGKITYANPAAQQQHLMPRETGVGHPLLEDWPSVVASLKAGPERSTVREVENDGRIFLQRIHYLRDLEVIRSYYTDITELKQAEDLLRQSQSEAVLATLADFVPQMVWMCMPDGLNVYFNHRWVEYTGLTLEESYGRGWNTPFHPDDKQAAWDAWNHAVKTGEQYHVESRLQAADGTYRWFLMRGAPLRDDAGEIVRWFGTCTDIEELKQAGQTLLVAQRKLTETVVNQLPCCVALVRGCDLTFQLVNPGYRAISPDREMLGKSIQEVWPEKPGFEELCRGVLETGIPYFAVDEPSPVSRSSGGQPVLAYFSWSMYRVDLPGEDGRGLLITEWETTERKQADEALRSSQAKLQSIVGSAMDAVISVDERQRIVLFNQAAETVFQCPASEALGSTLDRFIPELLREVHREHIRRFGTEGISQRSMTSPAVLAGVRTNGEEFPIEATVSQVEADGEKLYTVILRDITGRKQAEQALLRSEKLASVGRMAATIAHEINNPLAATTNALYIAMSQKDLTETTRHYLEAADSELRRIAHITRQSLGFYREFNAPALTSVNAVLESAVDLLKSKIRTKQAVIEKEWDEDVEVVAVAGELRQVFANLLANSLDAIGQKGRIKLRVSAGSVPKNGHRCVRVTIADNGSGISAASRQHLFEPFFTTKGTIGTGLGLWVSKQIVDKHEGTIRVRSSASGLCTGTVFSLVLPAEPTKAVRKQSAGGLS